MSETKRFTDAEVVSIIESVEERIGMRHATWHMVTASALAEGFAAALDAHVRAVQPDADARRLREALERIAGLHMVAGEGFMPDSMSYLRPEQYYARVSAAARRGLLDAARATHPESEASDES